MPTRYFHGSSALLQPGDLLVPGEQIGVSVHGISRHVFATASQTDDFDSLSVSIDTAFEYGCYAADGLCTVPEHDNQIRPDGAVCFEHYDEFSSATFAPECVRIYEVVPVGETDEDPSSDFEYVTSVRMPAARIIARVDSLGRPWSPASVYVEI